MGWRVVTVSSASIQENRFVPAEVSVRIAKGLPAFNIVEAGRLATRKLRDQIMGVFCASGLEFPLRHLWIEVSPLQVDKGVPLFELAIAVGIYLADRNRYPNKSLAILGRLKVNGKVPDIDTITRLPIHIPEHPDHLIILPPSFSIQSEGSDIFHVSSLRSAIKIVDGPK